MRILLDTHTFLWAGVEAEKLSSKAQNIFLNNKNDLYLSIASIWEIAIKHSLNKISFNKPMEAYLLESLNKNTIKILSIDFRHAIRVSTLPFHHRDPFDRLIVSQSLEEKISILSCDETLDAYDVERLW
ncbi:MAG: twitching motility protein PilT [Legionellales bacterium RIFCSPHIGHO2_12_FULL_37_14]|nr:MAG: twitching motility protein PilT [Legionellales bacterium RIFCSPHIGHO2_12_FULL_37_14]